MKKAVVLGCNGQDGTFLCRHLLHRGYSVIGIARQAAARFPYHAQPFSYVSLDLLSDEGMLAKLLEQQRPELVFHVAALHASSGLAQYEPVFQQMLMVNVATMHAVLEYLRLHRPDARALYASSAKVFGSVLPEQIDEDSARVSSCLYSVTKNAAGDLIAYYRRHHGSQASLLWLFNHESELRPASFFIPKLARMLAAARRGQAQRESFATLDFYCDWGLADEYMDIAIDCLERAPGEDFVLATGRCTHARDLVERLAQEQGTNPRELDATAAGAAGQPRYQVRTSKLRDKLGRSPNAGIEQLVRTLVERELAAFGTPRSHVV